MQNFNLNQIEILSYIEKFHIRIDHIWRKLELLQIESNGEGNWAATSGEKTRSENQLQSMNREWEWKNGASIVHNCWKLPSNLWFWKLKIVARFWVAWRDFLGRMDVFCWRKIVARLSAPWRDFRIRLPCLEGHVWIAARFFPGVARFCLFQCTI